MTIAAAIPKGDRPEWMVQKLTELGVAAIVLVDCARSVVRWDGERAAGHRDRLARIVPRGGDAEPAGVAPGPARPGGAGRRWWLDPASRWPIPTAARCTR